MVYIERVEIDSMDREEIRYPTQNKTYSRAGQRMMDIFRAYDELYPNSMIKSPHIQVENNLERDTRIYTFTFTRRAQPHEYAEPKPETATEVMTRQMKEMVDREMTSFKISFDPARGGDDRTAQVCIEADGEVRDLTPWKKQDDDSINPGAWKP